MTPALFLPLLVYAVVLELHLALPGRWIDGYVIDPTTRPLRYRLNGLRVLLATVALYALRDDLRRHQVLPAHVG